LGTILVTGGTGAIGRSLIPKLVKQGNEVVKLIHHGAAYPDNGEVSGDILLPDFGRVWNDKHFDAVYHLAAVLRLGEDKSGEIWRTNVEGTKNVIDLCAKHKVPHLYYCSTAFCQSMNTYEISKSVCELLVSHSDIPNVTVFKPGIVFGPNEEHFSTFISLIIKVHRRAELIRRAFEGAVHLPPLEITFRLYGNPCGHLNIVKVEAVTDAMARIKESGTYWLTNPSPPTMNQIAEWVGQVVMLNIKCTQDKYSPSPPEYAFNRLASAFLPYLQGQDFPSNLTDGCIYDYDIRERIREILGINPKG